MTYGQVERGDAAGLFALLFDPAPGVVALLRRAGLRVVKQKPRIFTEPLFAALLNRATPRPSLQDVRDAVNAFHKHPERRTLFETTVLLSAPGLIPLDDLARTWRDP